jgi:hypothetical protein
MRSLHEVCYEYNDVATANLFEILRDTNG